MRFQVTSVFKHASMTLLIAILLILGWTQLVSAQSAETNVEALEESAFKQATALASPSIVRIQTVGGLERIGRMLTSTGPTTGVIVSKDGYIISSSFNFASNPASVLVTLLDGRRFPAKVIANNHLHMLTLLKIDTKDLTPIIPARKDSIRVGQWALAVGKTYAGPVPNISVGIVSALNRVWGRAVQTDAKISPVNYGGPLLNVSGQAIGVLVPLSQQGKGETAGVEWYDSGIGFAIPMEDIYKSLDRLKQGKDLHHGLLGITLKRGNQYAGDPVIDRVRYNSPAQKAGLKSGDIIRQIDDHKIIRQTQVQHALGNKFAHETVSVTVERNNKKIQASITLVDKLQPYESAFLGILPAREGIAPNNLTGVGIRYVYPESPAATAGLKSKDRIVRFNDTEISTSSELVDLVSRQLPGGTATLQFLRGQTTQTIEVQLSAIPNTIPNELLPVAIPSVKKEEEPPKSEEKAENSATKENDGDVNAENESSTDEIKTGRFTEEMTAQEHNYWAYVPDDYNPEFRYGLMVWIHPGGDTMEATIYNQWQAICDRRGILILSPKAEKISGWTANEADFIKDAVEQFTEKYSIDPQRIFLHSFSNGGPFTYLVAFKFRELFHGIATSASPLRKRPPENMPDSRLQLHLTCGENDNLLPLVQRTLQLLRAMKYPTSFTEVKGQTHKYPPQEATREIGRWADSLDRI